MAIVHTNQEETKAIVVTKHTHSADHGEAKAKKRVVRMKRRAREGPGTSTAELVEECVTGTDSETQTNLAKEASLGRTVRFVKGERRPPAPKALE